MKSRLRLLIFTLIFIDVQFEAIIHSHTHTSYNLSIYQEAAFGLQSSAQPK